MSVLHRLSLAQKFMILGLVASLMVLIPTALYLQRTFDDVALVKKQVQGGESLGALNRVVQFTQTHRGLSAGMLSGNEKLALRRPDVRDSLNRAMGVVDASLASSAASAQVTAQWTERKKAWTVLEQGVASRQLKVGDSTRLHTELIEGQLLVSEAVMDEFGLSLDPRMDTHMLMQGSLVNLVAVAEALGVMRAQGTVFLSQGTLPPEGRAVLQAVRKRVVQAQGELFRNLAKAALVNPDIKASLEGQALKHREQIAKTLALADEGVIGAQELTLAPGVYFDEFTNTIDGLYEFNSQSIKVLARTLHARVDSARQLAFGMMSLLALGALAAGGLALAFVRSITVPLKDAVSVARAVAAGDLTGSVCVRGTNEIGCLIQTLQEMQDKLAGVVSKVRQGAHSVADASAEIAMGNNDLSARTEQQASALQETAASMEELGSTVRQNADAARQANALALNASSVALTGGKAVAEVVQTMKSINDSSRRISDIISVIDAIAFQTNILALNAAVEAARAGEQGRGFAVVATEVRSLAGRSAQAAREIKTLISDSVERVEHGTLQVHAAGATMTEVVNAIQRVTDLMGSISTASHEQSLGVSQVGEAISQMDQVTQQNAALVEEMAASASSLKAQAEDLVAGVDVFKLGKMHATVSNRAALAKRPRSSPGVKGLRQANAGQINAPRLNMPGAASLAPVSRRAAPASGAPPARARV